MNNSLGSNGIKNIKEIYTPLSVARDEIWRRWNDESLRRKVRDYLGKDFPEAFNGDPKSVLFRFITTPNLEFQLAHDISNLLGLGFLFMEFLKDNFCTRNQDKLYLGKMSFFHEDSNMPCVLRRNKVINIEQCDGKSLSEIKTTWGEDFVEFHHRITREACGKINTFDVSKFKTNGESAMEVYVKVFSLFICNGVLLENYFVESNKDESEFTNNVIKPAFNKVRDIFGVKPLIVPLIDCEEDGYLLWQYYPDNLTIENAIPKT